MTTAIQLPPDLEQRLAVLAARTGRDQADYISEFIRNGLDDMEDYFLAAATMERVRKGEESVFTLEEVERELGLAD